MTRLYHSASSDALGQRCERAWWYTYVAGLRDPRVEWATIADYVANPRPDETGTYWWHHPAAPAVRVKSRQRSTALGVEMHARLEGWYKGEPSTDWYDVPGAIALSGLHLLPHPSRCVTALTERPIGDAAIVGQTDPHAPPVGLRVAGVLWAGYRDLVTNSPEELVRLRVPDIARGWMLSDYKSSADISRYALTPDELRADFAANLYGLATMIEIGLEALPAHWVYFESKRVRRAEPRDAVITRSAATSAVMAGCERSRHLDTLRLESSARCNTSACGDYGGCPHHHSVGGPCDARRTFGSLLQRAPKKEENKMALPPGISARLEQPAPPPNGAAPVSTFGQVAAAPPSTFGSAPPPATEAAAPPPPVEPKPRAPRQPKAAPPPAEPQPVAHIASASVDPAMFETFDMQGNFGPLTLSGHAKDVLAAFKILSRAA